MSHETLNLTSQLYNYLQKVSLREHPLLKKCREETENLPGFVMQISPEQGQLIALLVELIQAKKTLDIGTFTGYSALAVALALPQDGRVVTCELDKNTAARAQTYFKKGNFQSKIELHLGKASDTLQQLINANESGNFDFAFIDADKNGYDDYYEKSLILVRKGGLIAIDNVLWGGAVADPHNQELSTQAIRKLNLKLLTDDRISLSMLPMGDGLTLARKR